MKTTYENIAGAILGQTHKELQAAFIKRIEYLYSVVLKSVFPKCSDDEKQSIMDQIILVEKRLFPISSDYVQDFEKLSTSTLLGSYSMIAFEVAKIRMASKSSVQLACLLKEVFTEMLAMPELITEELKKQFATQISESLIDFAYASGMTENMSLRLMQYQHE